MTTTPTAARVRVRLAAGVLTVTVLTAGAFTGPAAASLSAAGSVPVVAQVVPVAQAQPLSPAAGVAPVPANWFTDWQKCSWGIGVPTALGKKNPKKAWAAVRAALAKKPGRAFIKMYGQGVYDACKRFINS